MLGAYAHEVSSSFDKLSTLVIIYDLLIQKSFHSPYEDHKKASGQISHLRINTEVVFEIVACIVQCSSM
jgi:hypothetical protein